MNSLILIGRLTKDVELRYTKESKKAVSSFSIAVERPYASADGQKKVDFLPVQVWGKIAENCANYLEKGSLVAVKGSIQNRSYDNDKGEKRYITEVVAENVQFLSRKKDSGEITQATLEGNSVSPDGYIPSDDDTPF